MNGKGITMGALGAVLLVTGCGRETEQKLVQTQQQLAVATNEITKVRAEASEAKVQLQAKISDLQQTVLKLTEEKADTEKQMASLKTELVKAQQEFQQKFEQQQVRINGLEQEKKSLTDQIGQVSQKLADLEQTHATTVAHLQAMREEFVKLTNEKEALEAKLHDLKALKEQIYVVKQELHEKKVEERKRLDRAESAMGNHGYLFKGGVWVAARTPGKYPLNQEIRLGE